MPMRHSGEKPWRCGVHSDVHTCGSHLLTPAIPMCPICCQVPHLCSTGAEEDQAGLLGAGYAPAVS